MVKTQITFEELKWRNQKCPFERVKKWRNGATLKCPYETVVMWCSLKDESILNRMKVKRDTICINCIKDMKVFIDWTFR